MVKYSSYTYEHKNFVVRFPHLRRLEFVCRSIRQLAPVSWLDFGAGDGAVFKHLAPHFDSSDTKVVLYEPEPGMRKQLSENLAKIQNVDFRIVGALDDIGDVKFDLVTALEVLEHLPLPERTRFYEKLAKHLTPGGSCLIEVPIEFGPVLFVKEFGRRFLKNRKTEYTSYELFLAGTFGIVQDSHGRYDAADTRSFISAHRGFDLRRFSRELREIGDIESSKNSPFPYLPRWANQCTLMNFKPYPDNG
jgi:SAM-dependent methyltransferase